MWKKILIGTLVTLLVIGVLGGVAAVSFGIGSRMGLAQARLSAPAANPNGSNAPQVVPPRLRTPNGKGQPNPGNSPRGFAQPFGRGNFQPNANMMIRRSPFGGNLFGAAFGFLIPLLVVVVLVLVIIRLARGGFGGFGHHRMPPSPPGAGGNVMYMRSDAEPPMPPKADAEQK